MDNHVCDKMAALGSEPTEPTELDGTASCELGAILVKAALPLPLLSPSLVDILKFLS